MAVKIMTNTEVATRCGDYLGQCSDARTRQLVSPVSRRATMFFCLSAHSQFPRPRHNSTQAASRPDTGLILSELYSH